MHLYPFRAASVCAVAAVIVGLCCPPAVRAQSDVARKLTVGIFNRTYLVQAYYRSEAWKAKVLELITARNDAATTSNLAKVDQIDKELANLQTLAQRQLTGDAPLTNIMDVLKDKWPAIAQEAGVDVIVAQPIYAAPGAALVDVTAAMVRHFPKKN